MNNEPVSEDRRLLVLALDQLQSAIALMDQGHAPGHITAHVDLAIHQLQGAIGIEPGSRSVGSDRNESGTPLVS